MCVPPTNNAIENWITWIGFTAQCMCLRTAAKTKSVLLQNWAGRKIDMNWENLRIGISYSDIVVSVIRRAIGPWDSGYLKLSMLFYITFGITFFGNLGKFQLEQEEEEENERTLHFIRFEIKVYNYSCGTQPLNNNPISHSHF